MYECNVTMNENVECNNECINNEWVNEWTTEWMNQCRKSWGTTMYRITMNECQWTNNNNE